jgi:uncharacterized protein YlzI (FlbEa/FlbD family)
MGKFGSVEKPMLQLELYSGGKIYLSPDHIESVRPQEGGTIHIGMISGNKFLVVDTDNEIKGLKK